MSITNLPASIDGSAFPFDSVVARLQRGMSLQINYNGGIMRRGVVFLSPSSSPQFMWWQTSKRFKAGEVPVLQTLLHDIEEIRWASLTLASVPQFDLWFSSLPLAMKVLLGHPKRGQQELRGEAQERRRLLTERPRLPTSPVTSKIGSQTRLPSPSRSKSTTIPVLVPKRERDDDEAPAWICPVNGCRLPEYPYCMMTGKLHPAVCALCGTKGQFQFCPASPRGVKMMHSDMIATTKESKLAQF